ncbi:radical SAM protein [Candidatus Gottesmanbacteria bacterium]|nr:radical SAM protein [Candidatus Gottesmanbacteria bacterium]
MPEKLDIVLINPGNRAQIYQGFGLRFAAVEPPYLTASIASYLRNQKLGIAIIDANAENLSPEATAKKVEKLRPRLAAVIVYGSQPSASTQNMTAAEQICEAVSQTKSCRVAIAGLHPSALPEKTFEEAGADFVIEGEEQLPLQYLAERLNNNSADYSQVPGLWYRDNGEVKHNPRAPLWQDLDKYLPTAAWDLLPMDRYRAHNWHSLNDIEHRSPYGAVYTSLGCPYACEFCCINAPFSLPGERHTIRTKSSDLAVSEMEFLAREYGVRHLKIVDEMFVLQERHYMGIVDKLIEKDLGLNIWAYARVDTVKPETLQKMKRAGINWLALGIESADSKVRDSARKHLDKSQIVDIVKTIQDADINVMGNYIFGLPDDTRETMQETFDLATRLNTEWANFYCAMAYPGSALYLRAIRENWQLPNTWHDYSQHSYDTVPLPTKYLSAAEVLAFRDQSFASYFTNSNYLDMIEKKFGRPAREHILEMTKVKPERKILKSVSTSSCQ